VLVLLLLLLLPLLQAHDSMLSICGGSPRMRTSEVSYSRRRLWSDGL